MLLSPADVVAMYQSGATIADIIKQGAHNHRWIYWCLDEAGVREVRREFTPKYRVIEEDPNTQRIRRWRAQGSTIEEIAATLDRSNDYVRLRLADEPDLLMRRKAKKRQPPKNWVAAPESVRIRELAATGMQVKDIAATLNRSRGTIRSHIRCERRQSKHTAASLPWPRINSNFEKALKGRRFEDVALKSLNITTVMRQSARFV